jgi:phosphoribosyl 1,2-cyclic phosphodiesterase
MTAFDTFTIKILASGSSGNAILVEAGGKALLLDAGLSARELVKRLSAVGADPAGLDGIIISHEHSDHIKGAEILARDNRIPIFINRGTHDSAGQRLARHYIFEHFETGDTINFNGLEVRTFSVSHDAADPVGFRVSWRDIKVGVVTDVGHSTRLLEQRLGGCHALVLEANHDRDLLDAGPYPPELKRRIKGKNGHLSNQECTDLLKKLHHPGLAHIVLAHLSETNNTPILAYTSACRAIPWSESPPRVFIASQHKPTTISLPPDLLEKEEGS